MVVVERMVYMATKYVFVTGGVVSGLGKGITAASLGRLLKTRGLKVASQKLDPYINVDPGTMSPLQHGEVFVTDDGTETDQALMHFPSFKLGPGESSRSHSADEFIKISEISDAVAKYRKLLDGASI